jgi:hypothetical protein
LVFASTRKFNAFPPYNEPQLPIVASAFGWIKETSRFQFCADTYAFIPFDVEGGFLGHNSSPFVNYAGIPKMPPDTTFTLVAAGVSNPIRTNFGKLYEGYARMEREHILPLTPYTPSLAYLKWKGNLA